MAVIAFTPPEFATGIPPLLKAELGRLRVEVDRIATAIGAGQNQTDLQRVRDCLIRLEQF